MILGGMYNATVAALTELPSVNPPVGDVTSCLLTCKKMANSY